jgi:hypothetical protein
LFVLGRQSLSFLRVFGLARFPPFYRCLNLLLLPCFQICFFNFMFILFYHYHSLTNAALALFSKMFLVCILYFVFLFYHYNLLLPQSSALAPFPKMCACVCIGVFCVLVRCKAFWPRRYASFYYCVLLLMCSLIKVRRCKAFCSSET